MKTSVRIAVGFVFALVLIRGLGYGFYLVVGSRILAAGGHVPDTALPFDFLFATAAVDFVAGATAGFCITRFMPTAPVRAAILIAGAATLIALAGMSSLHVNEWLIQFVPGLGIVAGALLKRTRTRIPAAV